MTTIPTTPTIANLTLTTHLQAKGHTVCELNPPAGEPIRSHGQTPDHAIAKFKLQLTGHCLEVIVA